MKIVIVLLFISVFVGCTPTPQATNRTESDSEIGDNTSGGDSSESETSATAYWYEGGNKLTTITLDIDNLKTTYIFGDDVNNYLNQDNNHSRQFCLHTDFQIGSGTNIKQLRLKAVPSFTFDPIAQQVNRFFRINSNLAAGNEDCYGSHTDSNNALGLPISQTIADANIALSIDQVCTNCLNFISSEAAGVKLYLVDSASALQVKVQDDSIKMSSLKMNIDVNSNSNNDPVSCSDSSCANQGFDCCLNGQCVNDATERFSRDEIANRFSGDVLAEYDLSQLLLQSDENAYRDYPQFYYICLQNPGEDPGDDDDGTDENNEALERANKNLQDYYCIEELKANAISEPFHNDPINGAESYSVCKLALDASQTHNMYYQDVMLRMYINCGCSETTYSEAVANCPKYTYQAVSNIQGNEYGLEQIISYMSANSLTDLNDVTSLESVTGYQSIQCIAPQTDPNTLPFQDLDVLVSSKSIPHRFFDKATNGNESIEILDTANLPSGAQGVQEGAEFRYLDNDKLFPLNDEFNMNSLLGQLNINLTDAIPAKVIDIEFDKQYYIATINGYYTPCPTCAKDSWFQNFTSMPITNYGVGLTSIGHTTKRDAWGSNTTFGNYEDTIFGRACWLPPTMLPFSHAPEANTQTQRLNRLKTQSAMYMNGYQRDWFGFNRGALIGSFDGVSWFAIGKGRIASSTSTKLYLAINAPFGDLASPNDHLVSVQEWDFLTTGAQYDYDVSLTINHPNQNEAGQCQRNHQCESDSDCITQLGWEYSCVDINRYKTSWPKFEASGAKEIGGDSTTGTILSLLNQRTLPPGTSSKKCVYRGAGSPCRKDAFSITNTETRKSLTCAPNFYCAGLDTPAVFNKEVARFGQPLQNLAVGNNHIYGQEANIPGRPLYYLANGVVALSDLPGVVKTTIETNLEKINPGIGSNAGLCRPGKRLPSIDINLATDALNKEPALNHAAADPDKRTDFISQIAGCNSSFFNPFKTASCPIIGEDGNYEVNAIDTIINKANAQNACGLEALEVNTDLNLTADLLRDASAFVKIEAKPLSTSEIKQEPTLARDACYRRAGSVCHTDLDCSPNYKHSELVDLLNPTFFGNEAERKYWAENLVCGQAETEPLFPSSPGFNTYNIKKNLCCREIGKDITIYTEDAELPKSELNTRKLSSVNPASADRYSRFSILESSIDGNNLATFAPMTAKKPGVNPGIEDILTGKQWETLNETAGKTCCGGGWVRKFSDGTNNWRINRLNFDVSNFRCLNYNTPLVTTNDPTIYGVTEAQNSASINDSCLDPQKTASGCSQNHMEGLIFDDSTGGTSATKPRPNIQMGRMRLHSDSELMSESNSSSWEDNPWAFSVLKSTDTNPLTYLDWKDTDEEDARKYISVTLPSFITWRGSFNDLEDPNMTADTDPASATPGTDISIRMERFPEPGQARDGEYNDARTCTEVKPTYSCSTAGGWFGLCFPEIVSTDWTAACSGAAGSCCYMYDQSSRNLKISYENTVVEQENNYTLADKDFYIMFDSPGTARWEDKAISSGVANILEHRRSSTPGNAKYYLDRFAKLELLGVPQVSYEPIYCNDNYQKLVPGIFKGVSNVSEFNGNGETYLSDDETVKPWEVESAPNAALNYESLNQEYVASDKLIDHEPIFSSNEFMCCKPLGTQVDLNTEDGTACCSGYAQEGQNNSSGGLAKCSLPQGTDVTLYLNKFISSEGISEELDNPLNLETDFEEDTGYPRYTADVLLKVQTIANEFCENGASVQGGAHGPFAHQPASSSGSQVGSTPIFSFVDSLSDGNNNETNGQSPAGASVFNAGYRWNTHLYCQ